MIQQHKNTNNYLNIRVLNYRSPLYGGEIKNIETDGELSATGMHDKIGVLVVEVPIFGNSPDYDLQKGDVILKVNDEVVKDINFFLKESNPFGNGMKIKSITVWRNQGKVILK